MKYKKNLFYKLLGCLLFFFTAFAVNGQEKNSYKKSFIEGNYLVLEQNYYRALERFLEAYQMDSSSANINFNIGFCYLQLKSQKEKALPYLLKAQSSISTKYTAFKPTEKNAPIDAYFFLSKALHLNYQFDEAIAACEKYKSHLKSKDAELIKEADRQIEISKNAKEYMANPGKSQISNMGDSINSPYQEYSPLINADESMLVFTTCRPGSNGDLKTAEGEYYEDIYISYKKDDKWQEAVPISININTFGHEASVGLSADGQQLFIYKDDGGDGNIYSSRLNGDTWLPPSKMVGDINSPSWDPSACISSDANTLYFASDRPGGFGGRDLYRCVRFPDGQWSKATNLGPKINTEFDEDAPFIHPNNVSLFFSSSGHKTMGGFDIFYANRTDSSWTVPINLLPPINTTDDDIFYSISSDGRRAYYSSVRPDGKGEKDICFINMGEALDIDAIKPISVLIGKIIAEPEGELLPDIEIIITDPQNNQIGISKLNSKSGKYILTAAPGAIYSISYQVDGEELFNQKADVPSSSDFNAKQKEIFLPTLYYSKEKKLSLLANASQGGDSSLQNGKTSPLTTSTVQAVGTGSVSADITNKKNSTDFKTAAGDSVYKIAIANLGKLATIEDFTVSNVEYEQLANGRYRYCVGTFKTYEEAKKFKEEVVKKQYQDAFIIKFKGKMTPLDRREKSSPLTDELTKSTAKGFEMHFKYNVTDIPPSDNDFTHLISRIITKNNSKGKVTLSIISSASYVPTRLFKDNQELAKKRAESAKELILQALKEKKIDMSKISFAKIKASVDGPDYKNDYLISKSIYEKFQYLKIDIE